MWKVESLEEQIAVTLKPAEARLSEVHGTWMVGGGQSPCNGGKALVDRFGATAMRMERQLQPHTEEGVAVLVHRVSRLFAGQSWHCLAKC